MFVFLAAAVARPHMLHNLIVMALALTTEAYTYMSLMTYSFGYLVLTGAHVVLTTAERYRDRIDAAVKAH